MGRAWPERIEDLSRGLAGSFRAGLVFGMSCKAARSLRLIKRRYLRRRVSVLMSVLSALNCLAELRHGMLARYSSRVVLLHGHHLNFAVPKLLPLRHLPAVRIVVDLVNRWVAHRWMVCRVDSRIVEHLLKARFVTEDWLSREWRYWRRGTSRNGLWLLLQEQLHDVAVTTRFCRRGLIGSAGFLWSSLKLDLLGRMPMNLFIVLLDGALRDLVRYGIVSGFFFFIIALGVPLRLFILKFWLIAMNG
ncbi:hypothetical protein MPH_06882 [Macrophomina phaseolina MS6]|uniref:Uncharacterized protein n=1 Tax=Macrophomina phaseolina (strain MS6) TaxID=1126212 RepID=K2R126_MACPH|nr:hypothetical protein MPH_06882 [Macrophomina phaseolina MS6]